MFQFQCRTHYNAVIEEVNKTLLFRNYPVFSSLKWRCLLLCTLFMGMSLLWLVSFLLSATNGSTLQNSMYEGTNLFIVAPLLFLVFICGLPVIYGCRKIVRLFLCVLLEELCFIIFLWDVPFYDLFYHSLQLSKNVISLILQHNLRYNQRSKCLMYFDQPSLSQPTVSFIML